MKALTWHGKRDVRVDTVPDPTIQDPTDVVVRVTSSGICGSDLHLYEIFGPFLEEGDILGHEPMGVVAEIGSGVTELSVGDRVVVPFNVSCGSCFMCGQGLHSQCETTQVREYGNGGSLFGYTKLYGQIPGGQAEYLRVPFGNTLPISVPEGPPDDRFVYLSDVLPTAWQAVAYADIPPGGSVVVLGDPGAHLADRPEAEHGDAAALRDIGVGHGLPGGGQDVGQVDETVVGRPLGHLDRAVVAHRHPQVLGLPAGYRPVQRRVAEQGAAGALPRLLGGLALAHEAL
ncbi:MAG TPA: alcohol dehydrogenase catalytic domain-containing protein, partial [Pseudonocardiaceae bacterium]